MGSPGCQRRVPSPAAEGFAAAQASPSRQLRPSQASAIPRLRHDDPAPAASPALRLLWRGIPQCHQFKPSLRHFPPAPQRLPGCRDQTQPGRFSGSGFHKPTGPQIVPGAVERAPSTQPVVCPRGREAPRVADRAMAAPRPSWSRSAGHPPTGAWGSRKRGWKTPRYTGKKTIPEP